MKKAVSESPELQEVSHNAVLLTGVDGVSCLMGSSQITNQQNLRAALVLENMTEENDNT